MYNVMPSRGETTIGGEQFRHTLAHFASGVTIITTTDADGAVHGMTATAFSSLSVDPPLVLLAVGRKARCHRHLVAGRRFGVSMLADRQEALSRHFGGRHVADIEIRFETLGQTQVIQGALATLECLVSDPPVGGGDHSIFIGAVVSAAVSGGDPLIHYQGRYRSLVGPGL